MYRVAASIGSLLVVSLVPFAAAEAQQPAPTSETPAGLRVFLDCQRTRCDQDHFRREINFVNHVRDRRDAQVHVLITSQSTGGGTEYTFLFIGLQDFAGTVDTLRLVTSATDTEDERREAQTQTIKLGLMHYVAHTPIGNLVHISYQAPQRIVSTGQAVTDPWNFWVFRISGGGDMEKESSTADYSINGSISANRTTETWKTAFGLRGNYNYEWYEVEEDSIITSTTVDWNTSARIIRSIGNDHWAAGAEVSASKSTRHNQDLTLRGRAAVEYSFFPYAESTRRSLTFLYTVGVARFDYEELTLFEKMRETTGEQELTLSLSAIQPWGSVSTSLQAFTFLHDLKQHRIELSGRMSFRLVRGLDFNMGGSVARIKDQIYLSAEGASEEEILLQQRQLGTDFRIDTRFSLSYRFGSIFNNVVNPRMDREGGGGRFFF